MRIKKIPHELSPVVSPDKDVRTVLPLVHGSSISAVLVAEPSGQLLGIYSAGDLLRLLGNEGPACLDREVGSVLGTRPTLARSIDEALALMRQMSGRLRYLPVVDYRGRLETLVVERTDKVRIGRSLIDAQSDPYVIAEIGLNHNGSLEFAQELIEGAAAAGAHAVKFQARGTSLYRPGSHYFSEDLSAQYVHRLIDAYSLDFRALKDLFSFVRDATQLDLICTAWDLEALEFLRGAGVDAIKIASADFTNHELLAAAVQGSIPVLASTGMCTESEIRDGIEIMLDGACDVGFFHCISSYPPDPKDLNLGYIEHLKEITGGVVGYSSHEMNALGVIPSVAKGAQLIERHITLDKSLEGTDHRISSTIQEFSDLCSDIRLTAAMVRARIPRFPTQGELLNQEALAKSLVAADDLKAGDVLGVDDIVIRSPGRGLRPYLKSSLVGKVLQKNIEIGDFFSEHHFELVDSGSAKSSTSSAFGIPWGIPVRYHDYHEMAALFEPDFFEVHLSAADLNYPVSRVPFERGFPHKFHTPDLFEGDHIIDLANADSGYRKSSINYLNQTFEHIRSVVDRIGCPTPVMVIASLGGFTEEVRMTFDERVDAEKRLEESLEELRLDGIALVAQTLPPFPWYLGGRRVCNLFVDPSETADLANRLGIRLCLDIAHTYLASEFFNVAHESAWSLLLPLSDHLHVVDAFGESGEGLNIGDGAVDFTVLSSLISAHAPGISFIPEIWQGHRNGGDGFRVALERLERMHFCQRNG